MTESYSLHIISEKELLEGVKKNNFNYYNLLIKKYDNLIKSLTKLYIRKYYLTPLEVNDIKNMILFFFFETINNFDYSRGKNFCSYTKEFMNYKISNYMRKFVTKSNQVMNFYSEINEESILKGSMLIKNPNNSKIENCNFLSINEKEVGRLFFDEGKSILEISKLSNRSKSSVYGTLNRIKVKFRRK